MSTSADNQSTTAPGSMTSAMNLASALTGLLEQTGHTVTYIRVRRDVDPVITGALITAVLGEMSEGAAWLFGLTQRRTNVHDSRPNELVYWGTWSGVELTLSGPSAASSS